MAKMVKILTTGLILICLLSEAKAITCKQFQHYVETYGVELVKSEAQKRGISEATINNMIRKCIRR